METKAVLAVESVDEILQCDHTNESYWAVLSSGTVYFTVQGGSNFWVCRWNPEVRPFKWKLVSSNFLWYCFLCCKFSLWTKSYGVTIQIKPLDLIPLSWGTFMWTTMVFNFLAREGEKGMGDGHCHSFNPFVSLAPSSVLKSLLGFYSWASIMYAIQCMCLF